MKDSYIKTHFKVESNQLYIKKKSNIFILIVFCKKKKVFASVCFCSGCILFRFKDTESRNHITNQPVQTSFSHSKHLNKTSQYFKDGLKLEIKAELERRN